MKDEIEAATETLEPKTDTKEKKTKRLISLDAYRGLIMLSLISHGFGLAAFAGHPWFDFLAQQVNHVKWEGMVYWDLIQPGFMFIVGVAMPFSYAKRRSLGDSHWRVFYHVAKRAVLLIVIANILGNMHRDELTIGFINVLNQIAVGYFLAFFVLRKSYLTQGLTAAGILFFYTLAWVYFPGNSPGGPWTMDYGNLGGAIDRLMIGRNYPNYYPGSNAIPATATIIFGLMTGRLVGSSFSKEKVMKILAISGIGGIIVGLLLSPIVPIIKRIWTASFTFYSAGFVILGLLLFYWLVEVKGYKRWTFFLVVIGMNSIAAYIMPRFVRSEIDNVLSLVVGPFLAPLGPYGVVLQSLMILGALWLILYFLFKRRIFFKV